MKLDNLKDTKLNTKYRRLKRAKNHLVMEVNDEDGIMDSEIYIISDVPKITKKQCDKLYDVSFDRAPPRHFLTIERFDPYNSWAENMDIETLTWKKFVRAMQEYYHPWFDDQDDDDFDE